MFDLCLLVFFDDLFYFLQEPDLNIIYFLTEKNFNPNLNLVFQRTAVLSTMTGFSCRDRDENTPPEN